MIQYAYSLLQKLPYGDKKMWCHQTKKHQYTKWITYMKNPYYRPSNNRIPASKIKVVEIRKPQKNHATLNQSAASVLPSQTEETFHHTHALVRIKVQKSHNIVCHIIQIDAW